MFTGIVDHCGKITHIDKRDQSLSLGIETDFKSLTPGESISVDGVCLTVVEPHGGSFRCDLSPETLRLTTAENYVVGSRVNLERALSLGDRLGGHFVMGHVDTKCSVSLKETQADCVRFVFSGVPAESQKYLVKKGSVAVNGVSLTVNDCGQDTFEVMVIPHTLERTNLNSLQAGSGVNVEFDWLTKTILSEVGRVRDLVAQK